MRSRVRAHTLTRSRLLARAQCHWNFFRSSEQEDGRDENWWSAFAPWSSKLDNPGHYGPEQKKTQQKGVTEQATKRVGAAECANEESKAEWVIKRAVQVNKQMDKRVAQYLHLDF